VADRDRAAADAVARELADAGYQALAVETDVVDRSAVERMADEVLARHGRIDILAANAGIYPAKPLQEMQDADFDLVIDVNVKGALHSIQACVPSMREHGYGRIVFTSSITGPIAGEPNLSHYAASKAALLGLMRSAALELVTDGITVNAVAPGNVRTAGLEAFGEEYAGEMVKSIPAGRLAEPEEVGWAVRFLASEEAAYITGQTIVIDGGQVLTQGGIAAA
jgi:3-oxoacyl-[acyl-carrier protein] reductase